MDNMAKLNNWTKKLLDTGKKNNLINFKDSQATSAQILFPDCANFFADCETGHSFTVFNPLNLAEEYESDEANEQEENKNREILTASEFEKKYTPIVKNKSILVYAQTPNPITAVKNIAKKAKEAWEEIGVNVAYLAFGFMKWNDKEDSEVFCKAPLLLVSVKIITGSVIDPVRIEISDDDVLVNTTFDYMLRENYGIALPPFEADDTLESYLEKVSSIAKQKEWEVICECKLGIFSFLKISMYEDLKNNAEKILKNQNIRALLGEHVSGIAGFSGEEHIVKEPLIDLHTVVAADASQIEAIEMAKTGRSFVLQGPPGTGKSQTITNIIAECLFDGKKVLFVSEKQAALNVVFDKLKKAGLQDFCLELHSRKANKKTVIDELNRTLEEKASKVASTAQDEISQKREAMLALEEYAAALHMQRSEINHSLYELFEKYAAQRQYPEVQEYTINNINSKNRDYFLHAEELLSKYSRFIPSIGLNYRNNPWYGFNASFLDFEEMAQLKQTLARVIDELKSLRRTCEKINEKYKASITSYSDALRWQRILTQLEKSDVIVPAIMSKEAYDYALPYLLQLREKSKYISQKKTELMQSITAEAISNVDAQTFKNKLEKHFSSLFTRMFSEKYKQLVAQFLPYIKGGKKISYHQMLKLSKDLADTQSAIGAFNETEKAVPECLGACYRHFDTDWEHVFSELNLLKIHFDNERQPFGNLPQMKRDDFLSAQAGIGEDAQLLKKDLENGIEQAQVYMTRYFDPAVLDMGKNDFAYCIKKLEICLTNFDKLKHWLDFKDLLQQIEGADLSEYIDAIIKQQLRPENVTGAYARAYYKKWIEYVIYTDKMLRSFSRIHQDQAVQKFAEKDALQYELNKSQIKARLSQQRPDLGLVAGGGAVAALRREGQKKRKQMPIRKLLTELGSLVQTIKPCFLMSPLSVSAFLEPGIIEFDTVVFDEASQIFPQDAVGAIYRGKQMIVVGDSKQMPPSNFFKAFNEADKDEEEDVSDFESILDICSAVFDTKKLAWHYRSRYEQLISFSNLNFYNNQLVTFPSSAKDRPGIGIDFHHADGIFDRKSKTNRAEAQYIVDLIFKNIEEYPERSLGVVAFSAAQQNMIDRLLTAQREKNPSKEDFFREDKAEPFFIKNLETVQGDERDTIIFSIAYAKDSQGRFLQNFGPVNREGGERRLNVAVTRAKDNIQVVSSIQYTDIDLANSRSKGVALLRAYLDYAQNGEMALERSLAVSSEDQFDSEFEMSVCEYLRDQGFTVDTQVGCSGYRIDLGLRRENSSDYVLAIECDGATYHSLKNARDRDCLRQSILESMGWKFYRIWSTDWFCNPTNEKERLLKAAKAAIDTSADPAIPEDESLRPEEALAAEVQERYVIESPEHKRKFSKYKQVDASSVMAFYRYDFVRGVKKILEEEAPLSEEYLLKRIVNRFGKKRVTNAVLQQFNDCMRNCQSQGIIRKNGFLYLQGHNRITLRVPGDRPEDKREIKYIAEEELADGLYVLIRENIEIKREGLYASLRELLGFSRTGNTIEEKLDKAIDLLKGYHRIEEKDGTFTVSK